MSPTNGCRGKKPQQRVFRGATAMQFSTWVRLCAKQFSQALRAIASSSRTFGERQWWQCDAPARVAPHDYATGKTGCATRTKRGVVLLRLLNPCPDKGTGFAAYHHRRLFRNFSIVMPCPNNAGQSRHPAIIFPIRKKSMARASP